MEINMANTIREQNKATEAIMAAKEIIVKKYVVRLSDDERSLLAALIRKGSSPAHRLLKARILLKADVSGWSDNQIIEALETSASMVYRVRKQLVEEGFEAVLIRKPRATPAVPRIFDGEKEAKLIALACSKPPKGRARWTLRLLENKVVELKIVDRASDSTIGRTLKKHTQAASETAMGHPAKSQQGVRGGHGRRAGRVHAAPRSQLPAGLLGRSVRMALHAKARLVARYGGV
jgi:transposase